MFWKKIAILATLALTRVVTESVDVRKFYFDVPSGIEEFYTWFPNERFLRLSGYQTSGGNSNIVNGEVAEEGRFPYTAHLRVCVLAGCSSCTGSLVTPRTILTAAHCISGLDNIISVQVEIGCLTFTAPDCEIRFATSSSVHSFVENPPKDLNGEAALIFLSEASTQQTVALANFATPNNFPVTEMGYGITQPFGSGISTTLLVARDLPTVDRSQCNSTYATAASIQGFYDSLVNGTFVTERMICAGGTENRGTCNGDSGGPLVLECADPTSDIQIGITSYGVACAYIGIPTVFVNVADPFVHDKIVSIVAEETGEEVRFVDRFEDFCQSNGTSVPTPSLITPAQYPTFSSQWNCPGTSFATGDGCDCGCGQPDPDCQYFKTVKGCNAGETCDDSGTCVLLQVPSTNSNTNTGAVLGGIFGASVLFAAIWTFIYAFANKKKSDTETNNLEAGNVVKNTKLSL